MAEQRVKAMAVLVSHRDGGGGHMNDAKPIGTTVKLHKRMWKRHVNAYIYEAEGYIASWGGIGINYRLVSPVKGVEGGDKGVTLDP